MRRTTVRLAIVATLVGLGTSSALAQGTIPPRAAQDANRPNSLPTVSMTLRVRTDALVKAAQDLRQMVRDGSMVGVPFLQELSHAISAEVAVEREAPATEGTSLRVSSDDWVRRTQGGLLGTPSPSAHARAADFAATPQAVSQPPATTYAAAMTTLAGQAAAIKSSAEAFAGKLPDDKAAAFAEVVSQARSVATELARMAQAAYTQARKTDPAPPKR